MESELASLHLSQSAEDRTGISSNTTNPHMIRIRRKSSNISRTNSNISRTNSNISRTNSNTTMFPAVPPSPTISEHSLIFERSVEDLTTLPSSSTNTLGSMTNLNMLTKQRSNSNVFLQRQLTGGSVNSIASNLMTPMMLPVSATTSNASNSNNTNNNNSARNSLSSHSTNHHHHHRRRTIENLVAPALDASCSLIADQSTQMDNVNVIHSRNSSIIGLNMALGLSRSSSISGSLNKREIFNGDANDESGSDSGSDSSEDDEDGGVDIDRLVSSRRISRSRRTSGTNNTSTQTSPMVTSPRFSSTTTDSSGKVLKFYSYVDMVSDEHINPAISNRRPSFLTGSVSSPLLTPSELLNSSVSNHSLSPPQAGTNFLKSPVMTNTTNKREPCTPYISPQLSSRRLSGNSNNNTMPRSPTYVPNGMSALSPPSNYYNRSNGKSKKSKNHNKDGSNNNNNNDIKFQIESSDEFSSDDDTAMFDLDQTNNRNNNYKNGNSLFNIQNTKQGTTTAPPSILKTSMFQTGNNHSNPDIYLKAKSRTYSNASYHPPPTSSRPGSTSSSSFRKLSIPNSNNTNGQLASTSPILPSPYSLQMENLGAVLRQKVSDSNPASKPSTPISK
ncbi:similar to Kazachstania naganishii KNAG_0M01980 hypothetical protein [Maudiozyma saulgeensis]|uniref:Uncharacterized protein n=1 Tax=Maudiozyma saulgeensis TaxID=1789683 RepID=A0A1X7QYX9_9SACH|nr:similar to Kazachstania naganishii KNAG_0M01980 hypothetical protein [Kazachstania saulgeensis]